MWILLQFPVSIPINSHSLECKVTGLRRDTDINGYSCIYLFSNGVKFGLKLMKSIILALQFLTSQINTKPATIKQTTNTGKN